MVLVKIGRSVYFRSESIIQLAGSIQTWIIICLCSNLVSGTSLGGQGGGNECACPGDSLVYRCTVQGSTLGFTVWNGTAFSGCQQNEVVLHHRLFTQTGGSMATCNNGDIVGQSLGVQGNNYTSQLNVTITPDMVGKTVMCIYDALTGEQGSVIILFTATIPGQFPPPNVLHTSAVNLDLSELTFSWSPVAPDCPAIHYNILASNCGSCPTTTSHTNITCTDVPTNGSTCTITVQTISCGNIAGNVSDPISITFYSERVPVDSLQPTENLSTQNSGTTETMGIETKIFHTEAYAISIGCLGTALIASVVVFIMVIVIMLKRSKAKIKAAIGSPHTAERRNTHGDPMYEDVTGFSSSSLGTIINTQDNVAYGHTKTSTPK